MKPNVDLTINRMFSTSPRDLRLNSIFKSLYSKFPWSKISRDSNPYDERELIYTGNKKERADKARNITYENGDECHRCGVELSHIPWCRHFCLCETCEAEMNADKISWQKISQQHDITSTSDSVVREMNRAD